MKKIALFGSTGMIGQRILNEALARGHRVTAIVRDASRSPEKRPNLEVKIGDALKSESVASAIAGNEVVVSSYGPPQGEPQQVVAAARALIAGVASAGKKAGRPIRLIVVGGAASLEVAPGVQLLDTPEFPAAWKPVASAHRDALAVYGSEGPKAGIDWTYFSPAAMIQPGTRTGQYRTATNQLVKDAKGESRISAEDYAVALLDEIEKPRFLRQRFTVAY